MRLEIRYGGVFSFVFLFVFSFVLQDNKTPITVANDSFEREIVSYLISKGAVNPQAMFDACGATYGVEGDLEEVKRILSSHPDSLEWTDEVGFFFFFLSPDGDGGGY